MSFTLPPGPWLCVWQQFGIGNSFGAYACQWWWKPVVPVPDGMNAGQAMFGYLPWFWDDIVRRILPGAYANDGQVAHLMTNTLSQRSYTGGFPHGYWNGGALPTRCTICITKRSTAPGRAGIGRTFLPYVPRILVDHNRLNTLGVNCYSDFINHWYGGFLDTNSILWLPALPSPSTGTIDFIHSLKLHHEVRTLQRRRHVRRFSTGGGNVYPPRP